MANSINTHLRLKNPLLPPYNKNFQPQISIYQNHQTKSRAQTCISSYNVKNKIQPYHKFYILFIYFYIYTLTSNTQMLCAHLSVL